MKFGNKFLAILSSVTLACVSCNRDLEILQEDNTGLSNDESCIIDGIVAVKVTESLAEQLEKGQQNETGIPSSRFERIFPDAGEWEPLHRKAGLHLYYSINLEENQPVTKAVASIKDLPGILVSEEMRTIRTEAVSLPFNDPVALSSQWYLKNDGSLAGYFRAGADLNVVKVWDKFTTGNPNVIVAVLDTGVSINNSDLSPIVIPMGSNGSKSFIAAYSSNPYVNKPWSNHGSHVAGIIAAVNNNGYGTCGIAGGGDGKGGVRILDCQMIAKDDSGNALGAYSANAITWAADHGATIANNSWSSSYSSRDATPTTTPSYYAAAIDYFCDYAGCDVNGNQREDSPMKGGVMFFSAGNNNWDRGQPAMYERVIAVGACGPEYEKTTYSSYGDWVDICAPGGANNYGSTVPYIWSCSQTGQTGMCGTSQSCPMVTGVAALILSYYGGPGFTAERLKEKLLGGANKTVQKYHSQPIGPMVDAFEAMMYGEGIPEVPALEEIWSNSRSKGLSVLWKVQSYDGDVVPSYLVVISKNESDLKDLNPDNLPESTISEVLNTSTKKSGATVSKLFTGLDDYTFYYATVFGMSGRGTYSPQSPVIRIRTGVNRAPEITTNCPENVILKRKALVSYEFTATDPDGDELTFTLDNSKPSAVWKQKDANTCTLSLSGLSDTPGEYETTLTVSDIAGTSTSKTISYTILANRTPEIVKQIENIVCTKGSSVSIDMNEYFKDEDEDELTFIATADNPDFDVNIRNGKLVIGTENTGTSSVSVVATDWDAVSDKLTFKAFCAENERDVLMYPNPVVDKLWIASPKKGDGELTVYSPSGKKIFSKTIHVDPFEHYSLDMSSCAIGVYSVYFTMDGHTSIKNIAKQ